MPKGIFPRTRSGVYITCLACGETAYRRQRDAASRYCSRRCFGDHLIATGARVGEKATRYGHHLSDKTKQRIRIARLGSSPSKASRLKMSQSLKGRSFSEETRRRISNALKGDKHPNWKGGVGNERQRLCATREYAQWRKAVLNRDDFRCFDCGERGGSLHVHHIYSFALYPRLRLMLENGQTLCVACHRKTATYGGASQLRFSQDMAGLLGKVEEQPSITV